MRLFSSLSRLVVSQNPRCRGFSSSKFIRSSSSSTSYLFRTCGLTPLNEKPFSRSSLARESTASPQLSKIPPTDRVSVIVDDISELTLLEVSDLTEILRQKFGVDEMPIMAVMMPGMGVRGAAPKGSGTAKAEEKVEKTAFDLKLEGFDAAAKIKIIKEVRTFTDLGLKEAKELVEKAPTVLKKGVLKEEAEKIIQKMKEAGAKVTME